MRRAAKLEALGPTSTEKLPRGHCIVSQCQILSPDMPAA